MNADPPSVWRAVQEIETSVGLTPGFLEKIYADPTDWSFVVKVHTLIDAALVHLIIEALGKPALHARLSPRFVPATTSTPKLNSDKAGILSHPSAHKRISKRSLI
jgi:hypothetical protein